MGAGAGAADAGLRRPADAAADDDVDLADPRLQVARRRLDPLERLATKVEDLPGGISTASKRSFTACRARSTAVPSSKVTVTWA